MTDLQDSPISHDHGRPPVADWLTDFDHQHPDYAAAAPEIWEEIRTSGCPIAHSERYGGTWVPVAEVAADDRPTQDLLWSRLQGAGIPGTSSAYGRMHQLKVPSPHATQARRVLAATPGAGERFRVLTR